MLRPIVATAALVGLTSVVGAQGPSQDHYWLVAREGSDTTHLERVHRRSTVDGRTILISEVFVPSRARLVVNADADEHGCIREATVNVYPWQTAGSGTPIQRVSVALTGDSVLVKVSAGGTTRRLARPVSGAATIVPTESDAAASLLAECARGAPVVGAQSTISAIVFPNLRKETIRASFQQGRVTLVSPSDSAEISVDDERRVVAMTLARGRSQVSRASSEETTLRRFQVEDYAAPVGAGYTAHDIEVRSDDGTLLRGTITLPARASGPVPVVVAISGSGPQNRDSFEPIADGWRPFRELAESLGRLGVAVLRMDDRGVGESEGDYGSSTERSQAADVAAALAMLRSRPEINSRQIALLGHSEGVRVAMMVAARDTGIAAIALLRCLRKRGGEQKAFPHRRQRSTQSSSLSVHASSPCGILTNARYIGGSLSLLLARYERASRSSMEAQTHRYHLNRLVTLQAYSAVPATATSAYRCFPV